MKTREMKEYVSTIVFTLIALAVIVTFTFASFYSNAVSSTETIGQSSLALETERLNSYLSKWMDALQLTAITTEYMMQENVSSEQLKSFLTTESTRYKEEIDANFTGIYGLIRGTYLDGSGWTPDADYKPKERAWYANAAKAKGKPTIVSPYLDAQTNSIMVSVSQLLYDKKSVIALDIAMDEIQTITQDIQLEGNGFGFVIDDNGLVVAHHDQKEKGKNYQQDSGMGDLARQICETGKGSFQTTVSGEKCTVFTNEVMDSWHVAMVISNTKLSSEIRETLIRNIIVCIIIFVCIVIFCTMAYRRMLLSIKRETQSRERVNQLNVGIVNTLTKTIDAKDRYTKGHSQRVANYSREIARRMGKTEKEQTDVYYAGLLHDLGKIRVPEDVINKPGRLTDEEFEQIKIHPLTGYHILKGVFENSVIAQGAKFHHEQYCGLGYPNGLKGENIPEIARILGVADAYDAMTSNRSYRRSLPQEVVREEIEKGKGVQFDPAIADIMLEMIDEDKAFAMQQAEEMKRTILVVDDEPISIKMTEFIMKNEPFYNIIGASNGRKALDILAQTDIDLVLLDVMMPDMDGFVTLAHIRETSSVPVVFMTSDKDIETIQRAAALGVDDYLTKPFFPMALKEVLHSLLQ